MSEKVSDRAHWKPVFTISRFKSPAAFKKGKPYKTSKFEGNALLNEGIGVMWDLIMGVGATAFSNASSHIGVGDSSTAAAAAQTGLQAMTNKLYKGMEAGYPAKNGQSVTWRAVFGASEGNFEWREFTVANGNSDAAANMNRAVSNQGAKASGQVWTIDVSVTLS